MNSGPQTESRASGRRSKLQGAPSTALCDRLSRARHTNQSQIPTDHDYLVSIRVRLINRRSDLPRLLLVLSSINGKNNDNDKNNIVNGQGLTGHSISERVSQTVPQRNAAAKRCRRTRSRWRADAHDEPASDGTAPARPWFVSRSSGVCSAASCVRLHSAARLLFFR